MCYTPNRIEERVDSNQQQYKQRGDIMKFKWNPQLHGNALENRSSKELLERFCESEHRPVEVVCRAREEIGRRLGTSYESVSHIDSAILETRIEEKRKADDEAWWDKQQADFEADREYYNEFRKESKYCW